MAQYKLTQKPTVEGVPYYQGAGKYFGVLFAQIGEELVCDVSDEQAEKSGFDQLVKAKRVKKLTKAEVTELKKEAE